MATYGIWPRRCLYFSIVAIERAPVRLHIRAALFMFVFTATVFTVDGTLVLYLMSTITA